MDVVIEALPDEAVPLYRVSIANISPTTKIILEKIRQEFVSKMNMTDLEKFESAEQIVNIREQFKREIRDLIIRYFPQTDNATLSMLVNYLLEENLGLGKIEILLKDSGLEEVVVNNHNIMYSNNNMYNHNNTYWMVYQYRSKPISPSRRNR